MQFLSEFLTESVETLERIANPKKPVLKLAEIVEKREAIGEAHEERAIMKMKKSLKEMDEAYLCGRGDLEMWTPEIMKEIDKCFVENFMSGGEPVEYLFFPNSVEYLNAYDTYHRDVDDVLVKHQSKVSKYTREYFAYSTIWEMRGYKFPVPLGTASVVECLHKIVSGRRKGFKEVSEIYFTWIAVQFCVDGVPRIDAHLSAG